MEEQKPASNEPVEDQPIRQNLVNTAVNFLLNPDVILKSEDSKESFLRKKGLTDAEISLSFDKANQDPRYTVQRNEHSVPPPLPPMSRKNKSSLWSQLSSFSSSVIVLGIALYGIHHFYKLYIEPWLFGKEAPKNRFSQIESQLSEINVSMSRLQNTVDSLQGSMQFQGRQLDTFLQEEVNQCLPTQLGLKDLKVELGNVKSLLLSRHQFPAIPKVAASIPSWQLPAEEEDINHSKAEDEKENQPINNSSSDPESNETVPESNETVASSQVILNGESSKDLNEVVEVTDTVES